MIHVEASAENPLKPPTGGNRRRLRPLLLFGFGSYFFMVLVLMLFERSLVFQPARHPVGHWNPVDLEFEDAWFESADGTRLHGWYCPHPEPHTVLLYAHGNAGNLTHRTSIIRTLQSQGISVLIFDYRGYGRSAGRPDEAGILADARAARAWLARKAGVDEQEIVLLGRSLGGAVAVDLAAQDGARGLILECTFNTLPDVAAYHFPWFPVRWVMRTRLDSAARIAQYNGPILQCHGTADTVVPMEFGRRLFEAAGEPKRFIELNDVGHNEKFPDIYYQSLDEFLRLLEPAAP